VGIEGEGVTDLQSFHKDKACAVRKAEIVVLVFLEDSPSLLDHVRRQVFNMEQPTRPKRFPELDGNGVSGLQADNGIGFIQYVVTGNQLAACLKTQILKPKGFSVMMIVTVLYGEKRRCIDENHGIEGPLQMIIVVLG